jgi:hypothetical protein
VATGFAKVKSQKSNTSKNQNSRVQQTALSGGIEPHSKGTCPLQRLIPPTANLVSNIYEKKLM